MTDFRKAKRLITAIAPELKVRRSFENSYESATNTIRLNLHDKEDYGFMRHIKEVHNCEWADEFSWKLWTVLHEVGHFMTENDLTEEEEEEAEEIKLNLTCVSKKDLLNSVELQDYYFNSPKEWKATEWAINFILTSRKWGMK